VASSLITVWPYGSAELLANIQTVSFVYAFSWIFVLTLVLPSSYSEEREASWYSTWSA
jgi:hypothetical protein